MSIGSDDDIEMGIQRSISSVYIVQAIEARARESETIGPV
jgi:hypothetical protein